MDEPSALPVRVEVGARRVQGVGIAVDPDEVGLPGRIEKGPRVARVAERRVDHDSSVLQRGNEELHDRFDEDRLVFHSSAMP